MRPVVHDETVTLEGLADLARRLVRELPAHAVVWLSGEIGTGKTAFVRLVTEVLSADRATSPTFALVHEYGTPKGPIAHVDCYRLRSPTEAADLDLDALQQRARLLLIEWPERAGRHAPPADVHLRFEYGDRPDRRTVSRMI